MRKNIKKKLLTAFLVVLMTFTAVPMASAAGRELVPMGNTVGIQMCTDGIIVVGLAGSEDGGGEVSPAGEAGIKPGDVIIAINEKIVKSSAEFMTAISQLDGSEVVVRIRRGESEMEMSVSPKRGESGDWQLGLWLRDSVSGIGTVTFYDPETGIYGALGHPISDADTGIIMPLGDGAIMFSTVVDIKSGKSGAPGELCGHFDVTKKLGGISINSSSGIFGQMDSCDGHAAIPIASSAEIRLGKASILTNVRGCEVEEFEVEITRVYRGDASGRSMMISVTDPELLALTGGIVQGMSGSPVIQDGKLIGAVTHVLVNDPSRGYGISIDEMLETADSLIIGNAA